MKVKQNICPICGRPNNCAFEKGLAHGGCWCEKVEVPKELRERVSEELRGKACICEACVNEYNESNK